MTTRARSPVRVHGQTPILEFIRHPIYDAIILPTAWTTAQHWFAVPLGQNILNASVAYQKTATETNLRNANEMPFPSLYQVSSFRMLISHLTDIDDAMRVPSTVLDEGTARAIGLMQDIHSIRYGAWLQIDIDNSIAWRSPAWMLPDAFGMDGLLKVGVADDGAAGAKAFSDVIAPWQAGPMPVLTPNRPTIQPGGNISAWITPDATGYTLTDQVKLWLVLEGGIGREVAA